MVGNANLMFGAPSSVRFPVTGLWLEGDALCIATPRLLVFLRLSLWRSELYWFN